ncbi:MAG TPA: energy transducer TonB [Vicinamibacterales bacterium]|nr:energy transducer TonB [Vicinamibacterales bacterium]
MQRFNATSGSRWLRVGALVVLACLVVPTAASAQAQATEADLRSRIARQPNDPGPYIELAKIYTDQQRYADAIRMLQTAIATIQQVSVLPRLQPPAAVAGAPPATLRPLAMQPDTVRVGGDIKEPKKIKHVAPIYPDIAQASKVQGVVILELVVDQTGAVADARVLRSVALLDQAALDAVMQWQFTPTLLNGNPVSVLMTVTVNFSLSR